MNDLIMKGNFENMIYEIRGIEVVLDSDLARIYECANGTKSINLIVKRNKEKFPSDFCFQLTEDECMRILRFQFETLNNQDNMRGQHIKYLPYVFTEQGVAMLATVIHTKVVNDVSVNIMCAFVKMRHFINNLGEKITTIVNIKENNVKEVLLNNIDKIINNR